MRVVLSTALLLRVQFLLLIDRLWQNDACNFRSRIKERWNELKNTTLSVDSVAERIRTYQTLFEESGAFAREQQLWPEKCSDIADEADFMIDWYARNMVVMDSVFTETTKVEHLFYPLLSIDGATLFVEGMGTKVTLYDVNGRVIELSDLSDKHQIDLPYVGVFIVRVEDAYHTKVYKVQRSR